MTRCSRRRCTIPASVIIEVKQGPDVTDRHPCCPVHSRNIIMELMLSHAGTINTRKIEQEAMR